MRHSYAYSIRQGWFHRIQIPRCGQHDRVRHQQPGRLAGFYTGRGGVTRGFLLGAFGPVSPG